MMTVLSVAIFLGAFAASVSAIALSVAPQWRRIARLAMGDVEQFVPATALTYAERRIAVRRWASAMVPAPAVQPRATA